MSHALRTVTISPKALFMQSPDACRTRMPWLHLLLALALLLQAVASAAASVAGTTHRHAPSTAERPEAPTLQLVDFRRRMEAGAATQVAQGQAHSHTGSARHHHAASATDLVRTAEDQAADAASDAADEHGLAAPLALLPPSPLPPLLAAIAPQVPSTTWGAKTHAPALPERPPRSVGASTPGLADA